MTSPTKKCLVTGATGYVWWSVFPFHGIIFGAMQRNIAKAAKRS